MRSCGFSPSLTMLNTCSRAGEDTRQAPQRQVESRKPDQNVIAGKFEDIARLNRERTWRTQMTPTVHDGTQVRPDRGYRRRIEHRACDGRCDGNSLHPSGPGGCQTPSPLREWQLDWRCSGARSPNPERTRRRYRKQGTTFLRWFRGVGRQPTTREDSVTAAVSFLARRR